MPNSPTTTNKTEIACHRCGKRFLTQNVEILRFTFPADRFCAVCREREAAESDLRRAALMLAQADIPPEHSDSSFENFEIQQGTRHAFTLAKQWSEDFRRGRPVQRGLLLHGRPGAGKTHLAVAILREAVYGGETRSYFLNVPHWLNALRESWSTDQGEEPPNPHGYELVVIDDIGAENATNWTRERIYSLINNRSQQRLPTIITTNLAPAELATQLGRATFSRLTRLCGDVPVDAARDYREIQAQRLADLESLESLQP